MDKLLNPLDFSSLKLVSPVPYQFFDMDRNVVQKIFTSSLPTDSDTVTPANCKKLVVIGRNRRQPLARNASKDYHIVSSRNRNRWCGCGQETEGSDASGEKRQKSNSYKNESVCSEKKEYLRKFMLLSDNLMNIRKSSTEI